MELMNHGDVADKDLVNQFGGIAYDHESMPKVVAVHTWTAEMHSSTNQPGTDAVLPSVEQLPSNICYSMKIGIRSRPQTPDDVGSQRRFTGFKENWGVKNTKVSKLVTSIVFLLLSVCLSLLPNEAIIIKNTTVPVTG